MSALPIPNRAGMICFNRAGLVLVCSALGRTDCWVFPKGHIEQGESSYEAAERECEEECRVKATCDYGAPLGQTEYDYKGEHIVCEWWAGLAIHLVEEPESGDEISWGFRTIRWATWEEALGLLSFPDMRNMLRRALCLEEEDSSQAIILTDVKELSDEGKAG